MGNRKQPTDPPPTGYKPAPPPAPPSPTFGPAQKREYASTPAVDARNDTRVRLAIVQDFDAKVVAAMRANRWSLETAYHQVLADLILAATR